MHRAKGNRIVRASVLPFWDNGHNIYWDPLNWLVKNGYLIVLIYISFFNELLFVWGAGTFTAELLLWYCAMFLWRDMDSRQLLHVHRYFQVEKQGLTYIRSLNYQYSCRSAIKCDLAAILFLWTSYRLGTRHSARHSLNTRNVTNWKLNLKENIIKILRRRNDERSCNYRNWTLFLLRYEMWFKLHLIVENVIFKTFHTSVKSRK